MKSLLLGVACIFMYCTADGDAITSKDRGDGHRELAFAKVSSGSLSPAFYRHMESPEQIHRLSNVRQRRQLYNPFSNPYYETQGRGAQYPVITFGGDTFRSRRHRGGGGLLLARRNGGRRGLLIGRGRGRGLHGGRHAGPRGGRGGHAGHGGGGKGKG